MNFVPPRLAEHGLGQPGMTRPISPIRLNQFEAMHPEPNQGSALDGIRALPAAVKGVVLSVAMFLLLSVDFAAFRWSATTWEATFTRVASAIISTGVAALVLSRTETTFLRLAAALFAISYGTMYLLPASETFYLGSTLPYSQAIGMATWGALITGAFSLTAAALYGSAPNHVNRAAPSRFVMPLREWTWKFLALAAFWTLLFILFGFAVYTPIAKTFDPAGYAAESSAVTHAGIALMSQPLWAIAWVAMALPILRYLRTGPSVTAVALAALLGGFMGVDMLLATHMSFWLQLGHFAESVGESAVFGLAVVWVLQRGGRLEVAEIKRVPKALSARPGTASP